MCWSSTYLYQLMVILVAKKYIPAAPELNVAPSLIWPGENLMTSTVYFSSNLFPVGLQMC